MTTREANSIIFGRIRLAADPTCIPVQQFRSWDDGELGHGVLCHPSRVYLDKRQKNSARAKITISAASDSPRDFALGLDFRSSSLLWGPGRVLMKEISY